MWSHAVAKYQGGYGPRRWAPGVACCGVSAAIKQNRPWKVVTVRRGFKEDPDAARERHFAAHPEDRGANVRDRTGVVR